jgi:hypothetical protein
MYQKPFHNDADQRTRKSVIENDRKAAEAPDSYIGRAMNDIEAGGRFAKLSQPKIIGVAANPIPRTPSVWDGVDRAPEPSLGYSVDWMEPYWPQEPPAPSGLGSSEPGVAAAEPNQSGAAAADPTRASSFLPTDDASTVAQGSLPPGAAELGEEVEPTPTAVPSSPLSQSKMRRL